MSSWLPQEQIQVKKSHLVCLSEITCTQWNSTANSTTTNIISGFMGIGCFTWTWAVFMHHRHRQKAKTLRVEKKISFGSLLMTLWWHNIFSLEELSQFPTSEKECATFRPKMWQTLLVWKCNWQVITGQSWHGNDSREKCCCLPSILSVFPLLLLLRKHQPTLLTTSNNSEEDKERKKHACVLRLCLDETWNPRKQRRNYIPFILSLDIMTLNI